MVFRSGLPTVDAIFVLLTEFYVKTNVYTVALFIYQKAFDSVDQTKLELFNSGIQGKILTIIRSLYDKVKCCVKYKGVLSDYFQSDVGSMQGETLSPLLFSLYVSNLEIHFVKDNCPSLEIQGVSLFLLMYADDMVLFSESRCTTYVKYT